MAGARRSGRDKSPVWEVHRIGGGYALFEDGRQISVLHPAREHLLARRDRMRETLERSRTRRRRKCMGCPEMILSEGPHHRMCEACRGKSQPVAV